MADESFEQQVAEALASGMRLELQRHFCAFLAPRVAAAIEAARTAADGSTGEEIDKRRWAYEAALQALGGGNA